MKIKYIVLLFYIFSCTSLIQAQNIENSKPNENEIKNLSNLCKVWGFLKYYHPNVAKGNFNWDEHLLTILPKIENSKIVKKYQKSTLIGLIAQEILKNVKPVKLLIQKIA